MALSDVYMLTDYQRFPSGESFENVWFYKRVTPAGTAQDLVGAFNAQVRPAILNLQAATVVHYLTRVISLGDVADFYELGEAGIVGANAAGLRNTFDAYAFTLRPSTRDVRPGSKRIGGVYEADANYTDGVVTNATQLGFMQALRAIMATVIPGVIDDYQPVIVKRVLDGGSYRLPETDGELIAVAVSQALVNTRIVHQVSRGNGR